MENDLVPITVYTEYTKEQVQNFGKYTYKKYKIFYMFPVITIFILFAYINYKFIKGYDISFPLTPFIFFVLCQASYL